MSIIMPKIEKYEVCDYTPKLPDQNFSIINKEVLNSALKKRKFTVIKTFTDINEARKFMEGTEYIVRYVFKELPNDNNN